jgi:hypothetical protein
VEQLLRKEHALLLENALIDTDVPTSLAIPAALRAPANEDQGTYLVQARGAMDGRFRALLQNAGAVTVSYIPNNAELVRISASSASQLAANPLVQSVLPYEPYYKLDTTLLKLAVEGTDLPPTIGLNLTVFGDARADTLAALKQLGAEVASEEATPFGPLLRVHPAPGTFLPVATLPGVMRVEPAWDRMLANDLTRVRLGITTNTSNATPYLSLTGTNIVIAINDSGVDGTHPDLAGRVSGSLSDANGHGTHVTATIIGNGSQSASVGTNASGSLPGADFRGMAPAATAVVTSIGFNTRPRPGLGSPASDSALQEGAAQAGRWWTTTAGTTVPRVTTSTPPVTTRRCAMRCPVPRVRSRCCWYFRRATRALAVTMALAGRAARFNRPARPRTSSRWAPSSRRATSPTRW